MYMLCKYVVMELCGSIAVKKKISDRFDVYKRSRKATD